MSEPNVIRISEEIPDTSEGMDAAKRDRLMWMMIRENYRIAKEYEQLTNKSKFIIQLVVGISGAFAGLYVVYEVLFKHK